MTAITLDLHSIVDLTDEQFYQLAQANPDIKIERDAEGKIIVMPPTGGNTSIRLWHKRSQFHQTPASSH